MGESSRGSSKGGCPFPGAPASHSVSQYQLRQVGCQREVRFILYAPLPPSISLFLFNPHTLQNSISEAPQLQPPPLSSQPHTSSPTRPRFPHSPCLLRKSTSPRLSRWTSPSLMPPSNPYVPSPPPRSTLYITKGNHFINNLTEARRADDRRTR